MNLYMKFYRYKFIYDKNKNESKMVLDYEDKVNDLDTIVNTLLDIAIIGVKNVDNDSYNDDNFELDKYYSSKDYVIWQYYESDGIVYKNVFSFDYEEEVINNLESED